MSTTYRRRAVVPRARGQCWRRDCLSTESLSASSVEERVEANRKMDAGDKERYVVRVGLIESSMDARSTGGDFYPLRHSPSLHGHGLPTIPRPRGVTWSISKIRDEQRDGRTVLGSASRGIQKHADWAKVESERGEEKKASCRRRGRHWRETKR